MFVQCYGFDFYVPIIFKEAENDFLFRIHTKLGDYKHSKGITFIFYRRTVGVKFSKKVPTPLGGGVISTLDPVQSFPTF